MRQTIDNKRIGYPVRGFTLVELLVTMAIFLTIITIATGALFSAQAVNVRLEQTQLILDEVNLSTEVMVRDIRYGTTFYCDTVLPDVPPTMRKSCTYPTGGTVLVFRPATQLTGSTNRLNDRVAYYISNGALYRKEYPSGGDVKTSQLTSSDIIISNLAFYVTGAQSVSGSNDYGSQSDINQPLVTIVISGTTVPPKANAVPVSFSVQTTASSREIDN